MQRRLLLPPLEIETPWLFCKVENSSGCQVMQVVHRSGLPVCPMRNHFSEIPFLNSFFTYLIVSLLSCYFSIAVEEIVFIINPVLLGAPLVLMGG